MWCRPRIHIPSPVAAIGDYAPWACAQRLKLHRRRGAAKLVASTASIQSGGCRAPSWAAATAPMQGDGRLWDGIWTLMPLES